MKTRFGLVLTTFPNPQTARRILDGLLSARLAACVQRLPIRSAYRWKGKVAHATEVLAIIKTKAKLYPEVEAYLEKSHPYETPEIVFIPLAAGFPGYLDWLAAETK